MEKLDLGLPPYICSRSSGSVEVSYGRLLTLSRILLRERDAPMRYQSENLSNLHGLTLGSSTRDAITKGTPLRVCARSSFFGTREDMSLSAPRQGFLWWTMWSPRRR